MLLRNSAVMDIFKIEPQRHGGTEMKTEISGLCVSVPLRLKNLFHEFDKRT
jgi:hypothetical protein